MKIVTRRIGRVIEVGDSLGLTLSSELLDLRLNPGDNVIIELVENLGGKRIIIEKLDEKRPQTG